MPLRPHVRVHASEAVYVCMGAEPWKGCTHVGYVHEAASLGLNMGVYARLSTHVCAGPCGLCAHMVNREAGTVLHLKMCDWPEGPQICRCPIVKRLQYLPPSSHGLLFVSLFCVGICH